MKIYVNGDSRTYKRCQYEEGNIIDKIEEIIKGEKDGNVMNENKIDGKNKETIKGISLLYRWEGLNYKGRTHDSAKLYGEVISNKLLNYIDQFNEINTITRKSSYIVDEHEKAEIKKLERQENSSIGKREEKIIRKEERIAKDLCGGNYKHIGKIVDYQVPLKDYNEENKNVSVGKIDIISVCENEKDPMVFLLELKAPESEETMLRCVLEGYTYYKVLDKEKLLKDMKDKGLLKRDPKEYRVVVAPLVFEGSQPYKDVEEMAEFRPEMMKLIDKLIDSERSQEAERRKYFGGISPYYLKKQDSEHYECHKFEKYYYRN